MATPPSTRTRIAFSILFAVALGLGGYVVWPFRVPLFLAIVLASVFAGPYNALTRVVRGRRSLAAALTTTGLLLVIVGPLAAVVAFLVGQVQKGLDFLRNELGIAHVAQIGSGAFDPAVRDKLDHLLAVLHLSRDQIVELLRRASSVAEGSVEKVLASSTRATFHTAIMLIAFYFFLVEGPRMQNWLRRVSPLAERQTRDLLDEFRNVSRASILGTAIAAAFQGVAATIGYALVHLPHAVFFGLVTLLASFIPVVGTLLVWLPAVGFLWLAGHHGAALLLGAWCLVFVVAGEHIGKPVVLRRMLGQGQEMHTGLVFLALLGGLEMFKLVGLVVGPLVFAFLLAMFRIYERDFRSADPTPS